MILKYKVPKKYKKIYGTTKTIYCKVLNVTEIPITKKKSKKIYAVEMLNFRGRSNILNEDELKDINFIDKIIIRRRKYE